jgi:hypothetical protein
LRLEKRGSGFVLVVPGQCGELCGERPAERVAQFARELGSDVALDCG